MKNEKMMSMSQLITKRRETLKDLRTLNKEIEELNYKIALKNFQNRTKSRWKTITCSLGQAIADEVVADFYSETWVSGERYLPEFTSAMNKVATRVLNSARGIGISFEFNIPTGATRNFKLINIES